MKASEALSILESLDPSHEVTLTINRRHEVKASTPVVPVTSPVTTVWDETTREWVIGRQFWPKHDINVVPYKMDITCKNIQPCSNTVH